MGTMIENLPYVGLGLIGIGLIIVLVGIFGLAHIKNQEVEALSNKSDKLPTATKKEIFDKCLDNEIKNEVSAYGTTENEQVLYLANKGMNVEQIARQLQRGKGEIQLILSLEQKKRGLK
ncbi:MAG: hypothetical protein ATN36_06355 [Epulopiscium sp. Nele67-Bin005]|nr:MAG: hypothetical protein ATN36_06355 [Epulopiscium sp. Nele67-Bin005]